jgi:23S rRNA (pseudouridine1915-N3)-methyltransferase
VKIVVIAVGKMRDEGLRAAVDDYLSRLRKYVPTEERELKAGKDFATAIPAGAVTVALEVHGDSVTSPELAKRVAEWGRRGKGIIAFLIGGAEGIPEAVSARADVRLSLSKLTLPHRLARVLLAEQLYRAMTILRGEPYARE